MMHDIRGNPYKLFDQLCDLGFTAGITIKGPWKDPDYMYGFIRRNIIPDNITLIVPEQVHGVDIVHIDKGMESLASEADGVITNRKDIALSVTTADCFPVIMADPVTGYFAAVHVGWRSFAGGMVENIFENVSKFNLDLKTTRFLIGPGIGDCCFEVGSEVAILFEERFAHSRDGSFYIDLKEAVRNKLEALGAVRGNIGILHECTSCRSDLYYSYRRDKDTPLQMVTFIFKSK